MSDELINTLDILKNRVIEYYKENSIIDHIGQVDVAPSENKSKFTWITSKADLPRTNFDPNLFPINPVIEKIVQKEAEYAINEIKKNSIKAKLDDDPLECIKREAVSLFNEQDVKFIILPRKLYVDVPSWNVDLNPNVEERQKFLHLGVPKSVRVIIPPQGVEFNDIIISGKTCNYFDFIQSNDGERFEVDYDHNRMGPIPFWVHIWCNYKSTEKSCNVTITK